MDTMTGNHYVKMLLNKKELGKKNSLISLSCTHRELVHRIGYSSLFHGLSHLWPLADSPTTDQMSEAPLPSLCHCAPLPFSWRVNLWSFQLSCRVWILNWNSNFHLVMSCHSTLAAYWYRGVIQYFCPPSNSFFCKETWSLTTAKGRSFIQ